MFFESFFTGQFFREAIAKAIEAGIPVSSLAYLLLLPLLTSMIAAARHLFGLTTYGTFIPAIISLIWLKLGLMPGFFLTVILFFWARFSQWLIKKTMIRRFKIDYLPRMAIFLLFLSLGLLVFSLAGYLNWLLAEQANIFILLVLVLVIQNLIEIQITLTAKEARSLVLETAFFALLGYGLLGWGFLQNFVLAWPGLSIILILVFNIVVGRYVGFRLLERYRFRSIID
ncbi:MAG: hypothetical protein JW991_04675 [Candidatus Pacebacteria bacterium]|nr:hypothetical protein [Candidatus Paceibacterota bacterium]